MQSDRSLRLRPIKIDLLKIVKLQFSFEKQTTASIYFTFDERLDLRSDHARVLLPIRD